MNSEKQSTNLQMTLRGVNRVGEGQKNVPKLRFKGYEDAWEQRKLGEIVLSEIKGSAKAEMIGGDTPYLETNYLNGGECLFVDSENNVDTDDVIVLWDGSQAGTVYHGFSGALGSTFKAYKTKCLGLFIFQQLKKNQQTIYDKYRTPNIPHVIKTFKDEYDVMLTSEEEQNEIGRYFQQIDHLITLHQRKYDALKSMKKTLLSKMFPKNGEDVPEIRFKEFTDAWEQRRLEEIFLKIRNAFVGTSTPYYVEKNQGGHFYIESNNVKHGKINHDTEVFINEEFYQNQKDKWLKTGDIVMVQSGHVGHSAVIPEYLNNSAAHALIMFQEYKIETNPYFINFQFQTESVRNKIDSITTGNTIKHILASDMKLFSISNTQKKEADKLGDFFISLDNLITLHQRKLEELKNMKKTLLQQMFV